MSSDPSRKLLEDSGRSPEASPSISSGSGVLRKSSRRRRDFSRAFSRAAKEGEKEKNLICADDTILFPLLTRHHQSCWATVDHLIYKNFFLIKFDINVLMPWY